MHDCVSIHLELTISHYTLYFRCQAATSHHPAGPRSAPPGTGQAETKGPRSPGSGPEEPASPAAPGKPQEPGAGSRSLVQVVWKTRT